jgi:ABC-type multidrug transport system fused ATPase/permease subunit
MRTFFSYVLRRFPLSRAALAMTALVLVLEYLTLSLMIPLAASAGASSGNGRVVALWSGVVRALGLSPSLLTWVWLFLVMLALRTSAGYGHQLLTTALAKQVHRRLSESVFARVLFDEPITQIYKRTVGFYISLAGDDTFRAGSMVNSTLLFLAGAGSALCGLILLFLFSRVAFATTVVFLGLSAAVIAACVLRMLRLNSRSIALSREAGTGFLEALNTRTMHCRCATTPDFCSGWRR